MERLRANYQTKLDSFDSLGSLPPIEVLILPLYIVLFQHCFPLYIKESYTISDRKYSWNYIYELFWVVLIHPSTTLRFGRHDLFIYRMALLWLNFYAVICNQIKQWSHLKKFVAWVIEIISRTITIYVEKLFQCFIPFQCHSHGHSFILKFGKPVNFVLGHFDNSHSHLDTKKHLNFFSIFLISFPLC